MSLLLERDDSKDQGCGKAWEVLFAEGMAVQYFENEEHARSFADEVNECSTSLGFAKDVIHVKYTWVHRGKKPPHRCYPVSKKPLHFKCDEDEGEAKGDAIEFAPVNPSGVELGEEIKLDEVLSHFKSFYRTKPYVSLIGGLCTQGKTKGDIDIFIRSAHRDIATEFRIIRMFPEKYWFRFQFHYPYEEETHPGVFTNFMDIYDEKIDAISGPELVLMSAPKTVELFKFAKLLKPAHGHYKGEEYSIDKLIEVVNAKPEWYEKGIYVQKKFDGVHVRCDVQRNYESGYDVIIWSEEGNDITKNLPTLRKELAEASKGHAISTVGELESWSDKKHQSRQQTTAIIHTKEVHPDESKVILNAFDTLFYDKDIHNAPYSDRLKSHAKIKDTEHIKKADYKLVHSPTELRKAVQHYAGQPGSEGAYLKRADFPYELDGKSLLNLKYKNTFSWDVAVKGIDKIKGANAWSYLCVIEDEHGEEIPCGKTYNCSIGRSKTEPLQEGDILKIEFVNLNKYIDPKTKKVWYNMWSPHPIPPWREDKKKPDNTFTAEKLVEASHGTVTEKKWPKRYEDAYPIEDSDPYLTYPDESKKWKGMCHSHIRGRSVHLDFRLQISKDYMIGWTLYIPKGLSKDPETFAEAKALNEKEIMPIVRETMSNPMKKFNCGTKEPEPIEWATYEGTVQPGAVGATKKEHAHFIIIDSFEAQFGAQKSYFHEYFCDGKIFNGRLVFRLLENKEEWKRTDEGLLTWFCFNALKSPTPYVISTRAVKKAWCSPYGASALPRNIRSKVPDRFHYWKVKDASQRRENRDELVNEIKKKLLKLDAIKKGKFKVLKQTFKGTKIIREGPTKTRFFFVTKIGSSFWAFVSYDDLFSSSSSSGLIFDHASKIWGAEGDILSGTILNPRPATPSRIEVLDQGDVTLLLEDKLKKFILKGKKLKGPFVAYQQESSPMWNLQKMKTC